MSTGMHTRHMGLKELKLLAGYKDQLALADALGVNQSTVQRMEAYEGRVTLRRYQAAAKLLGITLAEIFADDRTPVEMEIVRRWRSLSPAEQDIWAEHLRLASRSAEGSPETDPSKDPEASE